MKPSPIQHKRKGFDEKFALGSASIDDSNDYCSHPNKRTVSRKYECKIDE